jgi:hypothetical protein
MDEIIKFDPTTEELQAIVAEVRSVGLPDLDDKAQYALVKEKQVELKKLRVRIEKAGKAKREEANAFNKKVLALEHEYIGIIEPEERRLEALRQQADDHAVMKVRIAQLTERRAKIAEVTTEVVPDCEILEMDDISFIGFMQEFKEKKLADDQAKLEADRKELADKEAKIQAEKDHADAVERAREEERRLAQEKEQRLAREALIAKERAETEKKEAEERHARELVEAAEKAKQFAIDEDKRKKAQEEYDKQAEEAKRKQAESEEKFQAWLASHNYNEGTMMISYTTAGKATLWVKIGEYES